MEQDWEPIRIKIDTSLMEVEDPKISEYLIQDLLEPIMELYEFMIKIKRVFRPFRI